MSGTGFDYECSSLSPEGRLFQVEYAEKAVEGSSTTVGVHCKDGIILGTEKLVLNKLMVDGTDRRLYSIDPFTGGVINGIVPDGRDVIQRARDEMHQYHENFGVRCPGRVLGDRMAMRF